MRKALVSLAVMALTLSCTDSKQVSMMVLDPGHFHAALVFKGALEGVDPTIYLYAPAGAEAEQFLGYIFSYNETAQVPRWHVCVYDGEDFAGKMIQEKPGQAVVLSGNNRKKAEYILACVKAGINVLSDKPMAVNPHDFTLLEEAYALAEENGLVIYELMTERYDLLNMVEKDLISEEELFGHLLHGSPQEPAVIMESVHHFYKNVSGNPLTRPQWYYDVEQQGEGLADVTTHLLDLVNWQCFPGEVIDWKKDIELLSASHWATPISLEQYTRSTGAETFPDYLEKYIEDGLLRVHANGNMSYSVKGVVVNMSVKWNYEPPAGGGDTFTCTKRGSRATLKTVQDAQSGFTKQLYIQALTPGAEFEAALSSSIRKLSKTYPFLSTEDCGDGLYLINIPPEERSGHEEHFSKVAASFLSYLQGAKMPAWEYPNSLAKYAVTTKAVEMACSGDYSVNETLH